MSLLYPAGQTPYCTPNELVAAPTGISWSTIPPYKGTTPAQQLAEQVNILGRATAQVDTYVNQVLRATLDTEQISGPDYRVTVMTGVGNGRVILSRWPIMSIVSIQVAPNGVFPRQWTTLPAGSFDIEHPIIGVYGSIAPSDAADGGQSIVISPGYVNWCGGRNGVLLRIQYINGWPHTSITEDVAAGAMSLPVDDCTGWAVTGEFGNTGATGTVYDSGQQETVQVSAASTTSGPGNLTVPALTFGHKAGTMVTTLPQSVIWATILFASAQALTRGATSTTVHQIPGTGAGGSKGAEDLISEGELLLHGLRRTI